MNVLSEIKEDRKRLEDDYGLDLSSEQKEKNKKIHDKIRKNDDKVLGKLNDISSEIRFESEKNVRISCLLEPPSQKEFEQSLMWMTQHGSEKDYPLILKLSQKRPFDSPSIQYFFQKGLEKTKPSLTSFKAIDDKNRDLSKQYSEDEKISDNLQLQIETFVYQIRNVGFYLNNKKERENAQTILKNWLEKLQNMGLNPPDLTLAEYNSDLALPLENGKGKPSLTFFKRRPNLIEKVISIFKPEIKYTSPQALESLTKKLKKDSISLEAARILSEKSDFLSLKSFDYIHDKFPNEIPNESEQKNKFVTNISDCIASISYCLIAKNSEPIDLLRNQNKDKLELELPKNLYIEAINYIKNHHELSKEASSQANYYINKLLDILGEY